MSTLVQSPMLGSEVQVRVLAELRRAAAQVPAYRTLLSEHGVQVEDVDDLESFSRLCPLLNRSNTFDRFRLTELSIGGHLRDTAEVLTSSGHGGRFSFGVISREEAAASASLIDLALDAAFQVASRTTLAINCLPMGVGFSSHRMTVASTSVREDMAVALMNGAGDAYEQIVLVGDPLFLKRLTDYATEVAFDWQRFRMQVVIGEEIVGEHYRGYLASCLGLRLDRPQDGYIMSSFGVGELGLHLCHETPAIVALRRAAAADPMLAADLFDILHGAGRALPMIFTFDPRRLFIEVTDPDGDGYGSMTVSMLAPDRSVPLLRYQTGDIVRLLDRDRVAAALQRHGLGDGADLPPALLALRGRQSEALPNGTDVGFYKDALYADHQIARQLTGAFRLRLSEGCCTMHIQLARGQQPERATSETLIDLLANDSGPVRVVLWPYLEFPFGMTVDYERKFRHFVAGERDADSCG